jgi:thiosulfate/3-mercaptopyruvate sulfurtransferase
MADARIVMAPGEVARAVAVDDPLVVDLSKPESYTAAHVPGALRVDYAALVRGEPPVGGLLPEVDTLARLFSSLGLESGREVIAYDDEGNGRAGRLVWTLHALGHTRASIMDGGLGMWCEQGLEVHAGERAWPGGSYRAQCDTGVVAERDWILERLDDPTIALLDTRSAAEYRGEDLRSARGGHIPGALSFDWVRAMDADRHRRLRPAATLRAELAGLGVTPDREVVVYCQTHHRSSHTFVVLKHLGFERVRGYPGAWSEWGNRTDLPVRTGDRP